MCWNEKYFLCSPHHFRLSNPQIYKCFSGGEWLSVLMTVLICDKHRNKETEFALNDLMYNFYCSGVSKQLLLLHLLKPRTVKCCNECCLECFGNIVAKGHISDLIMWGILERSLFSLDGTDGNVFVVARGCLSLSFVIEYGYFIDWIISWLTWKQKGRWKSCKRLCIRLWCNYCWLCWNKCRPSCKYRQNLWLYVWKLKR